MIQKVVPVNTKLVERVNETLEEQASQIMGSYIDTAVSEKEMCDIQDYITSAVRRYLPDHPNSPPNAPVRVFQHAKDKSMIGCSIGYMTAEDFERATGRPPENDDLERVNCSTAGECGHMLCGWCDTCRLPRTACGCIARVP